MELTGSSLERKRGPDDSRGPGDLRHDRTLEGAARRDHGMTDMRVYPCATLAR